MLFRSVGISGQEGMQAVMASDFAIAQFRYLERLVLVHGRYNYKRIARLITYFFYKNTLFGFTLFWYNGWAFFSGQPCYNDYAMSCYNLFFTSLPIIVVAVLDTGITAHTEFAGRLVDGYDFIDDVETANDGDGRDADPSDPGDWDAWDDSSWHGTHVAGIIGATGDRKSTRLNSSHT